MNKVFEVLKKVKPQSFDLIVLFLLSACIRFFYAQNNFFIGGDSPDYIDLAKNLHFFNSFAFSSWEHSLIPTLNQNDGLMPTSFRPLLYPLMASLLWTGENFPYKEVLFVQVLMGGASVALTYLLAKEYFSRPIAVVSALLLTFSPLVIIFTGTI